MPLTAVGAVVKRTLLFAPPRPAPLNVTVAPALRFSAAAVRVTEPAPAEALVAVKSSWPAPRLVRELAAAPVTTPARVAFRPLRTVMPALAAPTELGPLNVRFLEPPTEARPLNTTPLGRARARLAMT